jgi:hypothetical protein
MKGNNSYQINNKGKLEFAKQHNNRITNLNYLNNKTQIFNKKYNLELNEHSNPSSSLINEKKKFNILIILKIMI